MTTSASTALPWRRLGLLAGLLIALWVVGAATGWTDSLTLESIPGLVRAAGFWGALLYIAVFAAGELIHVPGLVFMLAAMVVWGPVAGGAMAYVGGLTSLAISFAVVRTVGGKALGKVQNRWMIRALAALDDRPIRTVALLRLTFWLAPPLNYALALSNVRMRDYLVGSALGFVLPVLGIAAGFEWVRAWWEG
jgi:uncharacterized membrane protein YdjX (TVP38/TMEM64 family)